MKAQILPITVNTYDNIDTTFHNDRRKTIGHMYIYLRGDLLFLKLLQVKCYGNRKYILIEIRSTCYFPCAWQICCHEISIPFSFYSFIFTIVWSEITVHYFTGMIIIASWHFFKPIASCMWKILINSLT